MSLQHISGKLVYLMGASGAGKDTLLASLRPLMEDTDAQLRPLVLAQRHITRPASVSSKDEQHHPCTEQEFLTALAQGAYVMHWQSHGLYYGIPQSIDQELARGALVLVNGSRAYLPKAQERYPELLPVLVQVKPEALRQRLLDRGRESLEDIEKRVQRARLEVSCSSHMHIIDNSEALESTLQEFSHFIHTLRKL